MPLTISVRLFTIRAFPDRDVLGTAWLIPEAQRAAIVWSGGTKERRTGTPDQWLEIADELRAGIPHVGPLPINGAIHGLLLPERAPGINLEVAATP